MKWVLRILFLGAVVGGVVALRLTVFAPRPVEVTVVAVDRGPVSNTLANSKAGTVKARRRAKLSPGTAGIVTELMVERGQRVLAGAALLKLEDSTERAQKALSERAFEVAEATNRRACIAADHAERELARNRALVAQRIVSQDTLEDLETSYNLGLADCAVAAAEVERARAAVALAQAELDKTVLVAPFDAIIAEVQVELGEWVTPSVALVAAPDLIDAIDTSSLYISAPMDEVDAGYLRQGLPTRVTLDPYPEQSFPAIVAKVAPYVLDLEQQNRTLEIEVELDDQDFSRTLLPGTSADVEVILEVREDVLRIPAYTLLEGGRVLVVEGGVLVEREVQVGLRNWEHAEIVGGLALGDQVVASLDRAGVEPGAMAVLEGSGEGQ